MRLPHPTSLRGLLVLGTLLVTAPLFVAVAHATWQMRALTERSTRLIAATAETTRAGDDLARAAAAAERAARLRLALGDSSLDEPFQGTLERARSSLDVLRRVDDATLQAQSLAVGRQMDGLADAYADAVARHAGVGDAPLRAALDGLGDLSGGISRLTAGLTRQTSAALTAIETSTALTESRLLRELAALIPVMAVLIIGFLVALTSPMRRIDRAIEALGRGQVDQPIAIRGPLELVKLGAQLEWLRQRLIDVTEEKNRFLRHMSHELKTPLASIREGTELLLEGAVGSLGAEQREVAGILRDNGIQLQRHIENLLSFSAWEARAVSLNVEEFPLRDLVRGVIESHRLTILSHRLRLSTEVGDVTVSADRSKLRLILENLVSNAVKYTPHDGAITVRADKRGTDVVIDVLDSGPGIAAADRPRLFEAFYRGRSATMGPLHGSGIGLSVVREFTEAHGGRVELVDEGHTPGAHFRLHIPIFPRAIRRDSDQGPA